MIPPSSIDYDLSWHQKLIVAFIINDLSSPFREIGLISMVIAYRSTKVLGNNQLLALNAFMVLSSSIRISAWSGLAQRKMGSCFASGEYHPYGFFTWSNGFCCCLASKSILNWVPYKIINMLVAKTYISGGAPTIGNS